MVSSVRIEKKKLGRTIILHFYLSYDVAGTQWITFFHKNYTDHRCFLTLWHVHATLQTTSLSPVPFFIEIMFILEVTKSKMKGLYDKLGPVVQSIVS